VDQHGVEHIARGAPPGGMHAEPDRDRDDRGDDEQDPTHGARVAGGAEHHRPRMTDQIRAGLRDSGRLRGVGQESITLMNVSYMLVRPVASSTWIDVITPAARS